VIAPQKGMTVPQMEKLLCKDKKEKLNRKNKYKKLLKRLQLI
jgi:hypothetical protein